MIICKVTRVATQTKSKIFILKKGSKRMAAMLTLAVVVLLVFSLPAMAQNNQTAKAMNTIKPLPKDLEIELALSALPPQLRDSATVYVLNPDKGFEMARKGTNGFSAFVARTGDDAMRGSWALTNYSDDILYPISFDEAGSKAQMRVLFEQEELYNGLKYLPAQY